MKCKFMGAYKSCKLAEYLGRPLTDHDCMLCVANNMDGIVRDLISILSDVGAGRLWRQFIASFTEYLAHRRVYVQVSGKLYPKLIAKMEKMESEQQTKPIILRPQDLPPEIQKALEKYVKRGDQYRV